MLSYYRKYDEIFIYLMNSFIYKEAILFTF